jgi:site-specific DNA-methyltransferase (adenine-specific)
MSDIKTENLWLMKGDCLDRMKEIESGSVDMILTDPPYGTTACKWDSIIPLEPMWEQLKRVIKPNGAIVLFGSEPFSSALRMSNIKQYKYDWIWEKEQGTGFARSKKQPLRKHEVVSIFYSKQPTYNSEGCKLDKPRLVKRKAGSNNNSNSDSLANADERLSVYTHATKHSMLRFNRDRGLHPTQKPVALMEYLIKTYTNEGETVLDFTMGSGTTGVAALNLNRKFIGIEMDDNYFDIAKDRIQGDA